MLRSEAPKPFGKLVIEIVLPDTPVRDAASGLTSTVTDENCVRRRNTLYVTQKAYDKLRLAVQGA